MRRRHWLAVGTALGCLVWLSACVGTSKYVPAENVAELQVRLADPAWDGEDIPSGQQCRRFGGQGATPRLEVSGIPAGANTLILSYSDRSHPPMNNGGHGVMGYRIEPGRSRVVVPSVPGHTFDLPEGFFLVQAHRNPRWDKAGAYMPPCSGGKGNLYVVTVEAVLEAPEGQESRLLGKGGTELGRY